MPTLRFMTSSSAPLLVDEWRRFEERFGIRVSQGYGCSEIGWIAAQPGEQRRIGTVGRPHSYHRLSIVGTEGQMPKPGEMGAVELGGLRDNAYRTLADDGSLRVDCRDRMKTGDLGFLDDEGYLHLTGRAKDLIIRGGVNISPLEIDGVLMQRADVIEACTLGVPDKVYGEEVVAYVVLRPGSVVAAADILRHCAAALPAFKTPKQIVLSDELPKTERGKLDRKALVERWNTRLSLFLSVPRVSSPPPCGRGWRASEPGEGSALIDTRPLTWRSAIASAGHPLPQGERERQCDGSLKTKHAHHLPYGGSAALVFEKKKATGDVSWQALRMCTAAPPRLLLLCCLAAARHRLHARKAIPRRRLKSLCRSARAARPTFWLGCSPIAWQQNLGQPFTVENRGGAAGQIAATAVARSPADGSTLMFTTAAPITIAPLMNDKVQYDPRKDFVPIAVVAVMPVWLVVNASSPLKSAADIVKNAKDNPGKLNYGTSGVGTELHLAAEAVSRSAASRWCMCRSAAAAR